MSNRTIRSASPEKPFVIKIHTDSTMMLKIRLLETLPPTEPKLLQEMHIYPDVWSRKVECGNLRLSLTTNGTLIRPMNVDKLIIVVAAFVHRSRVFFINRYFEKFFEILSDDGKFFTTLANYFSDHFDWSVGDYISYDDILVSGVGIRLGRPT